MAENPLLKYLWKPTPDYPPKTGFPSLVIKRAGDGSITVRRVDAA